MDLIELYKDKQFKPGDRVYHKANGAIGTIISCSEHGQRVELNMMGFMSLQRTLKNRLTHKIPFFAYPKHIYKYCPRYILAIIYTWSVISLVAVSAFGSFAFSILAFISILPVVAGIVIDDVQRFYFSHVNIMLLYGVYETILFLISIYIHMNKAA